VIAVRSVRRAILPILVAGVLTALAGAAPAFAASSPWWSVTSSASPTYLRPGVPGQKLVVTATNLGDGPVNGATTPVRILDTLPEPELTPASTPQGAAGTGKGGIVGAGPGEPGYRGPVTCSLTPLSCEFTGTLQPYEHIEVVITLAVSAPPQQPNRVSVSGGGAPSLSISRPLTVSGEPTPFGVEDYGLAPEEEGGALDTRAGSHPFQLTTTLALNQTADPVKPPAMPRNLSFKLPPGLIGNPTPFPQCPAVQFTATKTGVSNLCPDDTAIGVAVVRVDEPETFKLLTDAVPVFNLKPDVGEPARFGFFVVGVPVVLDTAVRTGGDYGVTVSSYNTSQTANFISSIVTLWGAPGAAAHNSSRGWSCVAGGLWSGGSPCKESTPAVQAPFLVMPTSCANPLSEPLTSTVEADSWPAPYRESQTATPVSYTLQDSLGEPFGLDGCNKLLFSPEIEVSPDVPNASTPTGLTVEIHVPQDAALNPKGLAESNVRDTTVTLPEGLTLNPGGADGLQACSEAQMGFTGVEGETVHFTPGKPSCPDASKIGTVEIETPLLPHMLKGFVYLATPAPFGEGGMNPFGSLIAMYIVAEDPVSGTLVKLPGEASLDPVTGRLTTTFKNTPQVPFENLRLHFYGGARAPLSTPSACGSYETKASFTPWSGNEPVQSSSTFNITTGPNGGPCANPRPFAPGFQAGSTNIQAGAFTPFTTTMSRPDADQPLGRLSMKLPPGLLGLISSVKLCGEPQASLGTCGPESLIGHTVVSAGLGSNPVTVKRPGEVFITGPYEGAPYGLSIVNPAEAGPFNLGNVIVRAKIEVDPLTAALTIVSDPLPTILKGIPLQLQHVNVTIDRPGFTFNPTNCGHMAITGTMSSSEGASAPVSTPFQVTNCATLKFAPKFAVSTSAKTSKAKGASLTAKLSYPAGSQGTEANLTRVKVDLPIQLPSQLKTLQKACLAKVFEANPAACPPESIVGHAKVITPILPVPLTGPAYFVSHGGEAFPSLTMVLQGYGVTVDLVGTTLIKNGITSTLFKAVPDVPFNTFELTLPQGKYAALAANLPAKAKSSFCGQSLKMPTEFVAQNGAVIHQSTPVSVTGCPPTVTITKTKLTGHTLLVTVKTSAKGTVRISGNGLKTTVKKNLKAGTYQIRVALTKTGTSMRAHHKKTTVRAGLTVGKQVVAKTTVVRL
jgi:hypothetical protein